MAQLGDLLQQVRVTPKHIDDYIPIVGEKRINKLKKLAKPLKNKRLLNLNATAYGGGVAELLKTQVALMQNLGLDVDWYVMNAKPEFYEVTKTFHNNMQGHPGTLSEEQKKIYLEGVKQNAKGMVENYDFIIIHDPQPLAMLDYTTAPTGKWIWRCHIDTSEPNQDTWNFLYPYMKKYDAVIFTLDEFVKDGVQLNNLTFIPPSIDPLSPKNSEMAEEEVNKLMYSYNVDPDRPIIVQVSRFDPWKDPLGVIDVYRNIKKDIKGIQLILVGSMAHDDPEGWIVYDRVMRKAGEDFDIHVYTNFHNVGDVGVKAFQCAADVILQKSLKEGFGLTVAEGLWKSKPVIGGKAGGIKIQIKDGENGFLVTSIQEATEKTLYLLQNPEIAQNMGKTGKELVRERFLSIREIEDHLILFNKLQKEPCSTAFCST
ncbi:MAG: glycosyltransferase [Candidatus Gastranaerophilales bacterium]|nr:glycosyltransferase [Candidatus Gastranaerophilales bacterium]